MRTLFLEQFFILQVFDRPTHTHTHHRVLFPKSLRRHSPSEPAQAPTAPGSSIAASLGPCRATSITSNSRQASHASNQLLPHEWTAVMLRGASMRVGAQYSPADNPCPHHLLVHHHIVMRRDQRSRGVAVWHPSETGATASATVIHACRRP